MIAPYNCPASLRFASVLPDRIRAGSAVHLVGGRIVREEKAQIVIHVRKRRIDDLRRHEVREHLFHPDVVEPLHRHEIAEPHVGRLVRNGARPVQQLILRG